MKLTKVLSKFKKNINTFVKKKIQMYTSKYNKNMATKPEINFPKPDLNTVIATILYFKSSTNYIQNKFSEKNLFEKFEDYILENSIGEKLPNSKNIEDDLKLSEGERKKLYKEGIKTGLLIKDKNGRYKLNINYEKEVV
jgi:hypothetical protein